MSTAVVDPLLDSVAFPFDPALVLAAPPTGVVEQAEAARVERLLTRRILQWLSNRTTVEREFVFRAAARVSGVALDEMTLDAFEALKACQAQLDLDELPSRHAYRAWVGQQPVLMQWPSAQEITNAFGGKWSAARSANGDRPHFDVRTLSHVRVRERSEDAELLAGIRLWMTEDPDPRRRFDRYRAFALPRLHGSSAQVGAEEASLVDGTGAAEPVRLVTSRNVFIDRFGSWLLALHQAGELDGMTFEEFRPVPSDRRNYSTDEVCAVVLAAHGWAIDQGYPRLTRKAFDAFRDALRRERWEAGDLDPVPSMAAVVAKFGSLAQALVEAGVVTAEEAADMVPQRRSRLRREEALTWLERARTELGAVPSSTGYRRWRKDLRERTGEQAPTDASLGRLGVSTWEETVLEAFGPTDDRSPCARWTLPEAERALEQAVAAGRAKSLPSYDGWCHERQQATGERLPSGSTVLRKLGTQSWTVALGLAPGNGGLDSAARSRPESLPRLRDNSTPSSRSSARADRSQPAAAMKQEEETAAPGRRESGSADPTHADGQHPQTASEIGLATGVESGSVVGC